ncbi:MAG: Asp-tRNA(Asn)/Glu-tRNA(Gln) amidotransferase subunit GatC [Tissierellia bacterium]|nr:Asp-tRNA(Asn)/Glu-tRNA(Gln) amidotransferase subunit GatC [Tissierellia bacterium]
MNKVELDKIDVEKIYDESMLYMDEDRKEETIKMFKDVVEKVNTIFEIDTDGVDFFEITSDNISPMRKDEKEESLDRELALSNTKHREYGYFKIGKVVE